MPLAQTQFDVFAFSTSTSLPIDGDAANITADLRKDYGAFVAITDTNPSPVASKPGFYRFDLNAGERDVSIELRIFPTSATSGVQVIGVPMFYEAGRGAEILAVVQGSQVVQVASPNVLGNLVLTQGDTYDGIGNPKAQWTVATDYTVGWTVAFTIRDKDDVVVYTTTGTVDSTTLVSVAITTPTGLVMTGCPGSWQGKYDVQLTKSGSIKTIAIGTCFINEDQTR